MAAGDFDSLAEIILVEQFDVDGESTTPWRIELDPGAENAVELDDGTGGLRCAAGLFGGRAVISLILLKSDAKYNQAVQVGCSPVLG